MIRSQPEEYRAVREAAGLIELHDRGRVRVSGPDRIDFLHSMVSNDVAGLVNGQGCYATFLTPRGKIIADFYVYRLPEELLLDVDREVVGDFIEKLGQYIIMEDVVLSDASSERVHLSLQGPRSAGILRELLSGPLPADPLSIEEVKWERSRLLAIRRDEYGDEGFHLLISPEMASTFQDKLMEVGKGLGLRRLGAETREVLRVESGTPARGREIDGSRYPMEVRLDQALNFEKGCYVGQEVVAKATYIGGVSRLLVQLRMDGAGPFEAGDPILSVEGRKVGQLTSAVESPRRGGAIGLGYVKKAFAVSGQVLHVIGSDESRNDAEVVSG